MSRRVLAGAAVGVVVVLAVVLVLVDPFSSPASAGSSLDNGSATSIATVKRMDLSSQTQVSATLGYGNASTISLPGGTSPATVQQSQQSVASSEQTLADDQRALEQVQASFDADQRKVSVDCRGANAAESGTGGACAADAQAVTTDRQSVVSATAKVQADDRALAVAEAALGDGESSAATYGQNAVYTMLPQVGQIVRRGAALYAVDGQPASLLYGDVPASRAFVAGMSPGADVGELNWNLRGYGAPAGDAFTSATSVAIERFQSEHHLPATGQLPLGSIVFEPGAVRVTSVTPTDGAAAQAGPVLTVTSTRRVVTIALDASQQTSIKVGDPVEITLPDNSTTPGHVSYVGTVATIPSGSNGDQSSTPTIEVDVTPNRPGATGRLDQAPVDVSITTASVSHVLVVPVNALLALAGGGYAVEIVEAAGVHRLVAVSVGLFDDAEGLVQVGGNGLAPGQHVVVPAE
ncbi:MAG: peptidoglycan-binding protein [Actinobacteria bacterium]|nr:peptidoglycan-binding protein [Actinomycetota bacterium]